MDPAGELLRYVIISGTYVDDGQELIKAEERCCSPDITGHDTAGEKRAAEQCTPSDNGSADFGVAEVERALFIVASSRLSTRSSRDWISTSTGYKPRGLFALPWV